MAEKRLVDVDAVMKEHCDGCPAEVQADCKNDPVCANMRWLVEAPTVDAVEVVRCKDCKYGEVDDPDFPNQHYCHNGCGWNDESFFCKYGERRDNA